MRHLSLVLLASMAILSTSRAHAQATLVTGLGGPLDFGTSSLPRGDDGSSPMAVDLTPTFPSGVDFYGHHFTSVWININGSLTFGGSVTAFTPDPFPRTGGLPMIAGWWADVDTRPILASEPDGNQVYYAATAEHFVATWIDVGYFDMQTTLLNSFQIILTPAASGMTGAFDVELRYNRCEWTTGDHPSSGGMHGLGGYPAQAGFDAADGTHYVTLPGSRSSAVLDLCTTSNVDMPGVWDLSSIVAAPACGNGFQETGEECDDGNVEDHDYCDNSCHWTVPCISRYPDGGIDYPFPSSGSSEAGILDANGADALGGLGFVDAVIGSLDGGPFDSGAHALLPCMMPVDDGGRRPDAGTRFDAGTPMDASMRMDAGPRSNSLDVTGGGCGCRAAGRGSEGGVYVALAVLAALTRIRARARGRAGTSRRP